MEVMVVLFLVALILGVALPRFGGLPNGVVLDQARSSVEQAFAVASTRAVSTGQRVELRWMAGGGDAGGVGGGAPYLQLSAVGGAAHSADGAGGRGAAGAGEGRDASEVVSVAVVAMDPWAASEPVFEDLARFQLPADLVLTSAGAEGAGAYVASADGEAVLARWVFFPDGEAMGDGVAATLRGYTLALEVDRLTGRPRLSMTDDQR